MSKYGLGNFGHYRGRTLEQMLEAAQIKLERENERKATELEDELIKIIGIHHFNAWVTKQESKTWDEYINLLRAEIANAR